MRCFLSAPQSTPISILITQKCHPNLPVSYICIFSEQFPIPLPPFISYSWKSCTPSILLKLTWFLFHFVKTDLWDDELVIANFMRLRSVHLHLIFIQPHSFLLAPDGVAIQPRVQNAENSFSPHLVLQFRLQLHRARFECRITLWQMWLPLQISLLLRSQQIGMRQWELSDTGSLLFSRCPTNKASMGPNFDIFTDVCVCFF